MVDPPLEHLGQRRWSNARNVVESEQHAVGGRRRPLHPFRQVREPHSRLVAFTITDPAALGEHELAEVGGQPRGRADNLGIVGMSSDPFLHCFPPGTSPFRRTV
jgi:hypothetical protein